MLFKSVPGALRNKAALGLVLGAVLAALGLWLAEPVALQNLRLAQFDQFQRWQPREYVAVPVRVVDIDEASLQALGQWPWPRTQVAELVTRLVDAGAVVVALDVLLAEPDRTSPDHDGVLAAALAGRPVVLGASLLRTAAGAAVVTPTSQSPQPPYRMIDSGTGNTAQWMPSFDSAVWPLPVLAAKASGIGGMNFSADSDGVVRRVPLLLGLAGRGTPSLAAEALRVAQGTQNYVVRSTPAGVQDLRIGSMVVPTNAQGEMWLHYTPPVAARYVSAVQVLRGTAPPDLLAGNIILVGSSAAGLMDLRANPMGQLQPGVLAHANALEQVLSGQHLQRPSWAVGLEALVLVLGALLVGLVALAAPARWAAAVLMVALGLCWAGAWLAFAHYGWLVDAANPSVALLLCFGLGSAAHHVVVERQQRWLRNAFSRYVSPNRVAYLLENPDQLQLGGQRQVCSFVFTDLTGFTPLLEASDPAQVVTLLNDYLEAMLVIVFRHEGTLDRFVGDAVVVLFSAPVPQPDHRQRALDCALEMDAFATAYAARLQAQGIAWGETRIGVHCGEVIVGNFGGKTLFDYRALGDPINAAARLESVNKHLGTRVCVSQNVLDGCLGVPTRFVGRLVLKGKTQALQVFTPNATLNLHACAPAQVYADAMQLLAATAPPAQVLAQFESLALSYPGDPLVQLHLQRVRQGAGDDLIVMDDK